MFLSKWFSKQQPTLTQAKLTVVSPHPSVAPPNPHEPIDQDLTGHFQSASAGMSLASGKMSEPVVQLNEVSHQPVGLNSTKPSFAPTPILNQPASLNHHAFLGATAAVGQTSSTQPDNASKNSVPASPLVQSHHGPFLGGITNPEIGAKPNDETMVPYDPLGSFNGDPSSRHSPS